MISESSADESPPPSLFRQTAAFARSFWTDAGKQAAGNLLGLITCQGLCLACQLVNLIVLPKALGKVVVGQYYFATLFFPYFYCIGSIAGGAIPLRDIRLNPARFDEIASSFLTLAAIVSTLTATFAIAAIPFAPISPDERFLLAVVAGGAIFSLLGVVVAL